MTNNTISRGQLPRSYTVVDVRVENETTRSFVLNGAMDAAPGQFVMAWLPGLDEKPFSLSQANPLTLTVDRVGPFTTAMHALACGDRLWLRGPFGHGFVLGQGAPLIVSGGCGAAPLLYLAESARQQGQSVDVVLGARTAVKLFFAQRFRASGCAVHIATDDGSEGHHGSAVAAADALILAGTVRPGAIYACGPEPMLDAVHRLAVNHGLPCQLSYEAYMRCGIGVCGSCASSGCLVCRDGPVLSAPPAQHGCH